MAWDPSRREFVAGASLGLPLLATARAFAADTIAQTTLGKVRGVDEDGIKTFKGIAYGANTAGKNRFMPPVPAAKWAGVKDALRYGYSAPQNEPGKPVKVTDVAVAGAGLTAENEDCLVLNVWTPGLNDGKKRPVMFWCHGGGFSAGSGSSPITAGHNLAKRGDVVVITVNHRLNCLGFTNLSALGPDFAASGDVGMMDLVMALNWTRDNAAAFGGDAGNVTIFGQSGGGQKVATLLTMPSAKGLFHRAIIESGPAIKLVDAADGEKAAAALMAQLGIGKGRERDIQMVPIDKLMTAAFAVSRMPGNQTVFSPNVDGRILPQHPFSPAASPVSGDVPLIIGNTRTEMTTFDDDAAFSLTDDAMHKRVSALLGAAAPGVIAVYKKANPGASPSDIFFLIQSDNVMGAITWKMAERRAALNRGPVYLYYFDWPSPLDGGKYREPHTEEIPFVFQTIQTAAVTRNGPGAQALADKVSAAWLQFARTGNPDVPSLPHWTKFNAQSWPMMVFTSDGKMANDPLTAQRKAMFGAMTL